MDTELKTLFAAHGLRCTRQRMALYRALCSTDSHPTADELYRRVCSQIAGMSLATVYNTLEALSSAGLVRKLPGAGANGSCRYDADTDHHLHLRCRHSGAVADVPHDLGQQVLRQIEPAALAALEKKLGFRISDVRVELVGEFVDRASSNGDAANPPLASRNARRSAG